MIRRFAIILLCLLGPAALGICILSYIKPHESFRPFVMTRSLQTFAGYRQGRLELAVWQHEPDPAEWHPEQDADSAVFQVLGLFRYRREAFVVLGPPFPEQVQHHGHGALVAGVTRKYGLSLWLLSAMLLIYPGLALRRYIRGPVRRSRRRTRGLCPTCGYNLTGNVTGVCPECGAAASASDAVT